MHNKPRALAHRGGAAASLASAPRLVAVRGPAPARVQRGGGGGGGEPVPLDISVHGRHVDVTPEVERRVRDRLSDVLDKFKGANILESEGGLRRVDVRLMNSQASITLEPRVANKAAGTEAFVRMGQLKASEAGDGWAASLEATLASLERKLHKYTKAPPKKVDYRRL